MSLLFMVERHSTITKLQDERVAFTLYFSTHSSSLQWVGNNDQVGLGLDQT